MNKVKIMLSAITIMGVVGSALAFKVKADNFCYYRLDAQNVCSFVNTIQSVQTSSTALPVSRTIAFTGSCPLTTVGCDQKLTNIVID